MASLDLLGILRYYYVPPPIQFEGTVEHESYRVVSAKRQRTVGVMLCALTFIGCTQSVTGIDVPGKTEVVGQLHPQQVNCEGPDADPDCGGSGGDGVGTGGTTMSYIAPPLVKGAYSQFPYSLIGTQPWTYQMRVMITGNGTIIGDAVWGIGAEQAFSAGDGGTFNINTDGGAGSPKIRAKSSSPIHFLATQFTCSNCL